MNYTLNRDMTITSTLGHTIRFKKDVPVSVPNEMCAEVQKYGAVPVDGETAVPAAPTEAAKQLAGEERRRKIIAEIEVMKARNARGDFAGSGRPNVRVLARQLGFDIDAKERDDIWESMSEGAQ